MPRGCLWFVIVVFPHHTHLLFLHVYFTFPMKSVSIQDNNLMELCYALYIPSFNEMNLSIGLGNDLEVFYHIWTGWPS